MALQLQMSWNPNLLRHKRKTGPPLGLKNLGNSCYLNSVLQCLTYTPPLANFCLNFQHSSSCDSSRDSVDRKRDCPFCILEKRIARSLSVDLALDAPSKVLSCLRIFAGHLRHGHQEDAHEFLRYVIDACHNTCLRLKNLQLQKRGQGQGGATNGSTTVESVHDSTIVKDIFCGTLQSQVKCLSCSSESNKVDEFMDISLDVLHSSSLKDAMQKFFEPEVLDGNNKYRCANCKKLVTARKQMSIIEAPNVLVIQLKRFEAVYGGKIDKAISFDEVLVLSNFMSKASQDKQPEYNLFGTIVHSGFSPKSGHYYAYIKDATSRWYCCNDSYVSVSTPREVLSEKVYILFFSRNNGKPPLANSASPSRLKPCDSNGSVRSNIPKANGPSKTIRSKESTLRIPLKDVSSRSKIDENAFPKRVLADSNGKVANNYKRIEDQKKPFKGTDATVNELNCMEKKKTKISLPRSKSNSDIENDKAPSTVSDGGKLQSVEVGSVKEENVSNDGATSGRVSGYHDLPNGVANGNSCNPGSKRKSRDMDSCILLARDDRSREKLEELIQVLETEASSVLRSCGWADNVFSVMGARKQFCKTETNSRDEFKKKLISEAKRICIHQIPKSLKGDLFQRLRSTCEL